MHFRVISSLRSSLDSQFMDYEEIVLQRYPHADPLYLVPIHHHGDSSPWQDGEWVILERAGQVDSELGRGPTEESAWADAARKTESLLAPDALSETPLPFLMPTPGGEGDGPLEPCLDADDRPRSLRPTDSTFGPVRSTG